MGLRTTEARRAYRLRNRDRINELKRDAYRRSPRERALQAARAKRHYEANKVEFIKRVRAFSNKKRVSARAEILRLLGGTCRCCGESHPAFLVIDHVNGGGRAELKHMRRLNYYSMVLAHIRMNSHQRKYQILCHNCNFAKSFWPGGCPHADR